VLPAQAVVVDAAANEAITVAALEAAGAAPKRGDALLIGTGWDAHWLSEGYFAHPFLAQEVADWLVERGVALLGVDFMTPDLPVAKRPPDFAFPVHRTLLGNDVLIVENLRNLGAVAGRSIELHALPIPIVAGDGAPARVVARIIA
jgi:kynurenine formamidase